jgi:hypothetical protein
MSGLAEIQETIEKLGPEEQAELWTWFQEVEETDELVAAVDEGIQAAEEALPFAWVVGFGSYKAKYPKATEWSHLRTTNPIESTFATVRLRTIISIRFNRCQSSR